MVKKIVITDFEKAGKKIAEPITKFGGQPVWLEKPQWPVSKNRNKGRPMMFLGQIALEKGMLGTSEKKVAYIFVSYAESTSDTFRDRHIVEWEGGENAVVIQPGGILSSACDFKNMKEGSTLFDENNEHHEYIPKLENGHDPDFIPQKDFRKRDMEEKKDYIDKIEGSKIGGVPFIFDDALPDGNWKLLLQLECYEGEMPFELHINDETLFAFISADFKQGGLLIQE
jgi:uncharacterized protein YwqG